MLNLLIDRDHIDIGLLPHWVQIYCGCVSGSPVLSCWKLLVPCNSVLPKQNSRHDRRAWCGWSLWPHQSFWVIPFPRQRELCTEGLLGRHALGILGRTLCNHARFYRSRSYWYWIAPTLSANIVVVFLVLWCCPAKNYSSPCNHARFYRSRSYWYWITPTLSANIVVCFRFFGAVLLGQLWLAKQGLF